MVHPRVQLAMCSMQTHDCPEREVLTLGVRHRRQVPVPRLAHLNCHDG